jgi:YD repeat-containing protein
MEQARPVRQRGKLATFIVGALAALATTAAVAGAATYQYDSLGRVTQVNYSNGVVLVYTYDAAGNRTSVVVSGAPS